MPFNRFVTFILTPVLAAAAPLLVKLAGTYLPGHPDIDPAQLQAIILASVGWVAAQFLLWLHGHQKWEALTSDIDQAPIPESARTPDGPSDAAAVPAAAVATASV